MGWSRHTAVFRGLAPEFTGSRVVVAAALATQVIGFAWALVHGQGYATAAVNLLLFPLAVFGSWRLGRELLPDDAPAAWISLFLGFLATLSFGTRGVLALFTTLALVRMVNRSSGLEASRLDSVAITVLVVMTVYASASPWFAAVAAVAFLLDAGLRQPARRQLLFGVISIGTMVVYIVDHDTAWLDIQAPDTLLQWLAIAACVLLALNIYRVKKVHSRTVIGGKRLNPERVKAGMAVAVLACLQGLEALDYFNLLVATIGGLCLGIGLRRSFRTTNKGLRH